MLQSKLGSNALKSISHQLCANLFPGQGVWRPSKAEVPFPGGVFCFPALGCLPQPACVLTQGTSAVDTKGPARLDTARWIAVCFLSRVSPFQGSPLFTAIRKRWLHSKCLHLPVRILSLGELSRADAVAAAGLKRRQRAKARQPLTVMVPSAWAWVCEMRP